MALGEDAFEFLAICEDSLHNLGLVEARGVNYTTFQLDLVARHWCGEVMLIPGQLYLLP